MSQALTPLPRSESKVRFMARLGLDIRDPRHRQIYALMKEEAIQGRQRIIATLSQHSNVAESSIATSQIPAAVMDNEIRRIDHYAQPATRILYNLAANQNQPNEPNWIVRWMLWHVIRYRDRRQLNHLGEAEEDVGSDDEGNAAPLVASPVNRAAVSAPSSSAQAPATSTSQGSAGSRHYDVVRDAWRG